MAGQGLGLGNGGKDERGVNWKSTFWSFRSFAAAAALKNRRDF